MKGDDSRAFLDEAASARVQLVCGFINAEVARWRNQVIGVALASFAGMMLLFMFAGIINALVVVVIAAGFLAFWVARARRELAESYDKLATKRLVVAANKGLTFKARSSLTREQFDTLDLLPRSGNGWRSLCEIAGRAGDTTFSLHAVRSPGAKRDDPGFDGVLIRLTFDTVFPGHTIVVPEGRMESARDLAHGIRKRDLVLVDHAEFDRRFSAYSTDYASAKPILSPAILDLIVASATSLAPDIRMALLRRSMFVSVPNVRLLPEVTLRSAPLTPEQAAGQLVRLVAFAEAFANALEAGSGAQSLPLMT
jgi:hypothetical protein